MSDIKAIVKENLIRLRREHKLTQLELSQKINYSDKAISRWETGEVTPDVETLAHLAELYEIPITAFFLPPDAVPSKQEKRLRKASKKAAARAEKAAARAEKAARKQANKTASPQDCKKEKDPTRVRRIALFVFSLCFLWALILFIFFVLLTLAVKGAWLTFLWGVCATFATLFFFFRPFPHRAPRMVFSSLFSWCLLVCIYLQIGNYALFPILFLGIPAQALLLLYPLLWRKSKASAPTADGNTDC